MLVPTHVPAPRRWFWNLRLTGAAPARTAAAIPLLRETLVPRGSRPEPLAVHRLHEAVAKVQRDTAVCHVRKYRRTRLAQI